MQAEPAILLVEDEAIVAKDLQQTLQDLGYDVFAVAASAEEAVACATEKRPDLVLMDIRIKGQSDGIKTAAVLRQKFRCAVIYLTAHADDATVQRAKKTEPYGYLLKPVKTAELRSMIEIALYRRELDDAREKTAQLESQLARRAVELSSSNSKLKALTELNLQLASERDPRRLLEGVCRGARDLAQAQYAVLLINEKVTNSLFLTTSGLGPQEGPAALAMPSLDTGPLGRVVAEGSAWRGRSLRDEQPIRLFPPGYPVCSSYLAVPVCSLSRTYGWLCLGEKQGAEEFSPEDERVLSVLAGQAGRIYENGSLYMDLQLHAAQLRHLNRVYSVLSGIGALIIRAQTPAELFAESCRLAVEQGDFQLAWIGWLRPGEDSIIPLVWCDRGDSDRLPDDGRPVIIDADALSAIRARTPWACNDLAAAVTGPELKYRRDMLGRGLRSLVTLPLTVHDRAVGCIILGTERCDSFDAAEMRLLVELAGDISFALDHLEKAEKLNYLAYYDSLTGLANRTLFLERLTQQVSAARHNEAKFAVVVRDPERFDIINESFGRAAGDALLKALADRLVECTGDRDSVARIGPGQFASILPFSGEAQIAGRVLEEQYQAWLGAPFKVGKQDVALTACCGIAIYPDDAAEAEGLLANAEVALKRAGSPGDRTVFFTQEIGERIAERLSMETRLRRALKNQEFVLHYQPKVDLETRELTGLEALIRWQSPELGLLPPSKFIPLMEESGMIVEVGAWVLFQACTDRAAWLEAGLGAPRVSVNLSPVQLRRPDFVDTVRSALKRASRNAMIFESSGAGMDLEVTETLLVENVESNLAKLRAVRDLGIEIAIDDFGTGYSSLGYLTKMPVDSLKIDRSFTAAMLDDPSVMTLVSTIITLAHALKLKVVAEGVESEDQAKILRLLRCDQMQGYLVSRPVPYEEMAALLPMRRSP